MKVCNSVFDIPFSQRKTHLAIGIFDGVHLGHQRVIGSAVSYAHRGALAQRFYRSRNFTAVLSFTPHPSRIFSPQNPVPQIFDDAEFTWRIKVTGADVLVRQAFTPEFAALDADRFLAFLKAALPNLVSIHVGEDFRCGQKRSAGIEELKAKAAALGIEVVAIPEVSLLGSRVSSTRIRQLLADGKMADVNALLGYDLNADRELVCRRQTIGLGSAQSLVRPYSCTGDIVAGRALGRTIGFPTLNVPYEPEQLPRFGVYQVRVWRLRKDSDTWRRWSMGTLAIANYGLRPTVESDTASARPLLEIHLLEKVPNVIACSPGCSLHVEWMHFIRDEQKFTSLDELRRQIGRDIVACHALNDFPEPFACSSAL